MVPLLCFTFGHAMLSAVLLWAAQPPLDLWPLAWIAPLWWILLVRRPKLDAAEAASYGPGAMPHACRGHVELTGNRPMPTASVGHGIRPNRVRRFFRRPYVQLWLAGYVYWLGALHWLRLSHWTAGFGWVLLAFYLAFYVPAFVGLSRVAVHRLRVPLIVAVPTVWTGLEYARAHFMSGFSMGAIAHTQYRWTTLIQIADLSGEYGVNFLLLLVAACLAQYWGGKRWIALWPLLPAAAAIAAALTYGYFRTSGEYTAPGKNILLVQGSIDIELKFDRDMREEVYEHYAQLTDDAMLAALRADRRVDLIVWPETMFRHTLVLLGDDLRNPPQFKEKEAQEESMKARNQIVSTARQFDVPLILGIDVIRFRPGKRACHNSAVYVSREGELIGQYDKMHPVVFGERWPLVEYWPWLEHQLDAMGMNLTPGREPAVFPLAGVKLAPNICYETVVPHLIWRQVRELQARGEEPDVLVNLTNDGWFWGSSELDMHLACDVFRAIECRKPLLVAANTGISAWIDGDGRVVARGPKRDTTTILAEVRIDGRRSPYLAYGDWPAALCLAACAVFAAAGCSSAFRGRR